MPNGVWGSTTRATVLLLKDERWLEDNLEGVLPADAFDVTVAALTSEAGDESPAPHVDVVLMTLAAGVAADDGAAVVRRVRRAHARVPLLVFAAYAPDQYQEAWLEAGADDCISAPTRLSLVFAHLRALLRRTHPPTGGQPVEVGVVSISPDDRKLIGPNTSVPLTQREYALLAVFLSDPGVLTSRPELLKRVWGYEFDPGTSVLDVTLSRVRRKLEQVGGGLALRSVRGSGFVLSVPAEGQSAM